MNDAPLPSRPYPGLRPYGYEDRAVFCGRKDQSFALYRMIDRSGFLAVVGSSGSGKSSLVLAGLLPLLEEEREQGGRRWWWETMRPGHDPVAGLADLLTRLSKDSDPDVRAERRQRIDYQLRRSSFGVRDALREVDGFENRTLLLVVDQFEEVFRLFETAPTDTPLKAARDRDEATRFVQSLLEADRDPKVDVRIVITMRSDFIGDCARFNGLPEAVSKRQYLVPALTRDQREKAIVEPLEKFGASIEPELVERLHNDCLDDMDQLPVLQHALSRMWEAAGERAPDAAPRRITTADYEKVGKLAGALSKHANDILAKLPEADVEHVFRALSATDGEGRIVRRSLLFSQLVAETGISAEKLQAVLRPFRAEDCSFVLPPLSAGETLPDDASVSVGHEALLRGWERVSGDDAGASGKPGWRHEEDLDARKYGALLFLIDNKTQTLPLDSAEDYANWWREGRRTQAWTERYGGRRTEVEALIARSAEAVAAQRRKEAEDAKKDSARRRNVMVLSSLVLLGALGLIAEYLYNKFEQVDLNRKQELAAQQVEAVTASTQKFVVRVGEAFQRGSITSQTAKYLLENAGDMVKDLDSKQLTLSGRNTRLTYLLAVTDLAATLQQFSKSETYAAEAVELAKPLTASDPNNGTAHRLLAAAALRLGEARIHLPNIPNHDAVTTEAFALSLSEVEAAKKLIPDDPMVVDLISDVCARYGEWESKLGQRDVAMDMNKRSLAELSTLARGDAATRPMRGKLASAMERVGNDSLLLAQSSAAPASITEAKTYLNKAFEIRSKLVAEEPDNNIYISNLTASYSDLAKLAWLDQKWREALSYRRENVVTHAKLVDKDPSSLQWKMYFDQSLHGEIDDLKRSLDMPDMSEAERTETLQLVKSDYNQVIKTRTDMANLDPGNTKRRRDLAISIETFADYLAVSKLNQPAADMYSKAINAWNVLGGLQKDCKDCTSQITALTAKLAATQTAQP